ncbi:MAG: protein kinase [Kaiparowitsia implicata GSE-PSE-MK54-09C]|jgi:serine/threonine-protein kinase|nr:protein kinase [Kaiparowitsia implicata GSE-PSE-MK54-09C]
MSSLYCSKGHQNVAGSHFCYLCGEQIQAESSGTDQLLEQRYQILRQLGAGGFGRTYLAEDLTRFQERCVLKEFAPQVREEPALQKAEELFEREAGALYQLQHPQIPRFRELFRTTFEQQPRLFLVQDYVEGPTYQQLLNERQETGQVFAEVEVVQMMAHLLPVLEYIHSRGVIHRDISPDNLILRAADHLPVLIDFGGIKVIAAAAKSGAPPAEVAYLTRVGKVGYAPDEQLQDGRVFPHSDLYALAMTALALLTGRDPADLASNWQASITVSPEFQRILQRMLSNHALARYQSATEVLRSLQHLDTYRTVPPIASPHSPASAYAKSPPQTDVTQAVARSPMAPPPSQMGTVAYPAAAVTPASSAKPAKPRGDGSGILTLLLVALVLGSVGTGAWLTRDWWLPAAEDRVEEQPSTPYSPEEQARKENIRVRREQLGVPSPFLVRLTDSTFHRQHPELGGRSLSLGPEDATWREMWDAIAVEWLDLFEQHLSAESRRRLGGFTTSDRQGWRSEVNQLNVSSRALNDLADGRFFYLFPEWRGEEFIDLPIGQVWQAIALDQLRALQSGDRLEQVQIPQSEFSTAVNGTLPPGAGKVYIAELSQGQLFRLNVQAPPQSTLLSLYLPVPTQDRPVLLEDSPETQWSRELPQSGFYEVVVVSNVDTPIEYTVNLAADQVTTTPAPESPPENPAEDEPIGSGAGAGDS